MITQNFNQDWFYGNDAGGMFCAAAEQIPVRLPHDAMIHESRSGDNPSRNGGGFFPGGDYIYSKQFRISDEYRGCRVMLRFEGVFGLCTVYVNGAFVCSNLYGYTEFYADLTPHLNWGEENTIQVKVQNSAQPSSRWYSGTGIYRPVTLMIGREVHVSEQGIRITTLDADPEVSALKVEIPLCYTGSTAGTFSVRTRVVAKMESNTENPEETERAEQETAAEEVSRVTLVPGDMPVIRQQLYIRDAKLWSPEHPELYTCEVTVGGIPENTDEPSVYDFVTECFGIRKVTADPVRGLYINGERVLLRGACIHHDNGILGAAEYASAADRRICQLKDAGFNAIRMSHHTASRALLDACDRRGMLVMDETFDTWHNSKVTFDHTRFFEESWQKDVDSVVAKDYNHPSVIIYSIGNEIQEAGTPGGARTGRMLAARFHDLDETRFVTNAVNGLLTVMDRLGTIVKDLGLAPDTGGEKEQGDVNDLMTAAMGNAGLMVTHPLVGEKLEESLGALDICGYNYMTSRYAMDTKAHPGRLFVGTETYPPQIAENWKYVKSVPAILGDFTWTGYDYIGEAGIGVPGYNGAGGFFTQYPCYLANVGDLDILGYRRPMSYYREIVWGLRKAPYLAVQPPCHYDDTVSLTPWISAECESCWTWPGYEGKPCRVEVYSCAEETELFINGVSAGRLPTGEKHGFKAVFETVYTPGNIEAVSYENGKETGRYSVPTCKPELYLCAAASAETLVAGSEDLAYITLTLEDADGTPAMHSRAKVSLSVTGEGTLLGFGSADPFSTENFYDTEHTLYRGMLLAAVRAGETPGKIHIRACADGYAPTEITLKVTGQKSIRKGKEN